MCPSGRWPAAKVDRAFGPSLEWCEGKWKNAELDEAGLSKLVQQEVSDGFVLELPGAMEDALLARPSGVAKCKLSVARSLGKADRLVLGTTTSNVNPLAHIPEKTSVPALTM